MKKGLTIAGILVLAVTVAAPVFARGGGWGRGPHMGYWQGGPSNGPRYGGWYGNLTEDQRKQMETLNQKFYDETSQVRNELWAKRAELNTLLNTSEPDTEKAKSLQKEISELQAKLAQARIDYQLEVSKVNPDAQQGWRSGMGPGMMGQGYGMGPGMMGRGYGMGPGMMGQGYGMGPGMMGRGYGMGPGMMGRGYGMGPGMTGYGYGPGICWR